MAVRVEPVSRGGEFDRKYSDRSFEIPAETLPPFPGFKWVFRRDWTNVVYLVREYDSDNADTWGDGEVVCLFKCKQGGFVCLPWGVGSQAVFGDDAEEATSHILWLMKMGVYDENT